MGFITVLTDYCFIKDTVVQSVAAVLFDASIGLFKHLLYCKL